MRFDGLVATILVAISLLSTTACSVPTKQIDGFAASTSKLADAYTEESLRAPDDLLSQEILATALLGDDLGLDAPGLSFAGADMRARFLAGDGSAASQIDCELPPQTLPQGDAATQVSLEQRELLAAMNPHGLALAKALKQYALGLQSVANADGSNVTTAANSLWGAAWGLADTVLGAAGAGPTAPAGIGAALAAPFQWILGQYLADRKISALRDATEIAAPAMPCAAYLLAEQARRLQVIKYNRAVNELDYQKSLYALLSTNVVGAGNRTRSSGQAMEDKALIDERVAVAKAAQSAWASAVAIGSVDIAKPYLGLVKAHQAMEAALKDRDVSWSEAIKEMQAFINAVEPLAAVLAKN